jgi:hypothetical protein
MNHILNSGIRSGVEEPAVFGLRQLLIPIIPIFLAAMVLTTAHAQDLPSGWRRPLKSEVADDWRNKSGSRFLVVRGDFDGDGHPDVAELLVNPSRKRWAIFVKLGVTKHWQRVGDENEMGWLGGMGISLVKPGKHETACGKGYGDEFCAHGEPKYLKLSTDAIDFFKEESADSVAYWDQKSHQFRFIQMSD